MLQDYYTLNVQYKNYSLGYIIIVQKQLYGVS
jgi:hypothetical protein